ncbi:MAG: iron-sulfur cluster assembly accessory protein [Opitutales bacterium]|nr:iron-sulfur cluster assembly accessory protein [Opitutales bacterium]
MTAATTDMPEGVRLGNEKLVRVTDAADAKLAQLLEKEPDKRYLRVRVTGGGCSGLSYKMKFVADTKKGDILIRTGRNQLLIDSRSALYLKGMEMDYSDRLVAGGFKFNNPNAKASCSCGESFAV